MINLADLVYMRAVVMDLLPEMGVIMRRTTTAGSQGQPVESWGTAAQWVRCRVDPLRAGYQMLFAGAVQAVTSRVVTLPYDTDVRVADRLTVNGHVYSVEAVDVDKSWPVTARALVSLT
jgi:SPP1 family predicted phage head-tail adaptor